MKEETYFRSVSSLVISKVATASILSRARPNTPVTQASILLEKTDLLAEEQAVMLCQLSI